MKLNDLLTQIPTINKERDYWFVRTEGGTYFDTFINNEFIGIGWNQILLEDLVKKSPSEVKEKIAKVEDLNLDTTHGKSKASAIYNKLIRFNEFRKGDVIIIPGAFSSRWAFGIITDQRPYIDNKKSEDCEYSKRRKVLWQKVEYFNLLDPIFNQIKSNQHSISNINKYASYIDIVTNSLYFKGDNAHLVLNVKTTDEINAKEFFTLGNSLLRVLEEIQKQCHYDEEIVDETSLRLYLQSPGKIELKSISKKSLITLGLILSPILANNINYEVNDQTLQNIKNNTQTELDSIQNALHKMRVNSFDDIDKIYH